MLKSALYLSPSYSIYDTCKINQVIYKYSFTQTQGLKTQNAHICEQ